MPGPQTTRLEITNTRQRSQVSTKIAASAAGDHDRSTRPHEIAGKHLTPLFVEESVVVWRVAGRVERGQHSIPGGDPFAVRERLRGRANDGLRPALQNGGNSRRVIAVRVREEDEREWAAGQPGGDRFEVRGIADARIDERGRAGSR